MYICFGPWLDQVQTMFGPSVDHVQTMFRPCLGYVWTMFGPCLDHAWTLFKNPTGGPRVDGYTQILVRTLSKLGLNIV